MRIIYYTTRILSNSLLGGILNEFIRRIRVLRIQRVGIMLRQHNARGYINGCVLGMSKYHGTRGSQGSIDQLKRQRSYCKCVAFNLWDSIQAGILFLLCCWQLHLYLYLYLYLIITFGYSISTWALDLVVNLFKSEIFFKQFSPDN